MTLLDSTAIANYVDAECRVAIAERESRKRAHTWREPTGTGTACVRLRDGKVLVVTHAYAPYAEGFAYCVADVGAEALQLERDEAVAFMEGYIA